MEGNLVKNPPLNDLRLNRRAFVAASVAGGVGLALAACGLSADSAPNLEQAIAAAERPARTPAARSPPR